MRSVGPLSPHEDEEPGRPDVPTYGLAVGTVLQQQEPVSTKLLAEQPPAAGELVTCPECGEMAMVESAQRRAEDFCRRCDFPLFWARTTVILPSSEATGASLRRLPGTVGRAATASVPCPHCGEPNSPVAVTCVRCHQSMVIVAAPPPPPPAPVYIAPPPEPEPEPEPSGIPWWWIVLMTACVIAIGVLLWVVLS